MSKARLVVATFNPGKFREIAFALAGLPFKCLSLRELGLTEEVEENGATFLENARLKSLAYSLKSPHLTLAEDSGLEVRRLGGAPGIFSARFSAPRPTDEKNIRKVLRMLDGVPWEERGARFVCCLVLARQGAQIWHGRGEVRGRIAFQPAGTSGFGYDPIFYYHPYRRTFGELTAEEKNSVSHRGRALRKLKQFLASRSPGDLGPGSV